MFVRVFQMLPLYIIIAIVAFALYMYIAYRQSPNRAKEILIKIFSYAFSIISIILSLSCIYTILDKNTFAFEIAASMLLVSLVTLGIVGICRYIFLKNNPKYKIPRSKASFKSRFMR